MKGSTHIPKKNNLEEEDLTHSQLQITGKIENLGKNANTVVQDIK